MSVLQFVPRPLSVQKLATSAYTHPLANNQERQISFEKLQFYKLYIAVNFLYFTIYYLNIKIKISAPRAST